MPIKKIITSTVPNAMTSHFMQLPASRPIWNLILELSRTYRDKILTYEKYKDQTTVITKTTYETREISDQFDRIVYETFPDYQRQRDMYNEANGIIWSITYEEV
jgi:hypothetical protein